MPSLFDPAQRRRPATPQPCHHGRLLGTLPGVGEGAGTHPSDGRVHRSSEASAGLIPDRSHVGRSVGRRLPEHAGVWSARAGRGVEARDGGGPRPGRGGSSCKLWHVGRTLPPCLAWDGKLPVALRRQPAGGHISLLRRPKQPFETPRVLEEEEIPGIIDAYRLGSSRAREEGRGLRRGRSRGPRRPRPTATCPTSSSRTAPTDGLTATAAWSRTAPGSCSKSPTRRSRCGGPAGSETWPRRGHPFHGRLRPRGHLPTRRPRAPPGNRFPGPRVCRRRLARPTPGGSSAASTSLTSVSRARRPGKCWHGARRTPSRWGAVLSPTPTSSPAGDQRPAERARPDDVLRGGAEGTPTTRGAGHEPCGLSPQRDHSRGSEGRRSDGVPASWRFGPGWSSASAPAPVRASCSAARGCHGGRGDTAGRPLP